MRYVVRGVVQGVGFRWFVVSRARTLGLVGWVTNRPDGAVEVLADGPADVLSRLERELEIGPAGARVDSVEKSLNAPEAGQLNRFEIR